MVETVLLHKNIKTLRRGTGYNIYSPLLCLQLEQIKQGVFV